MGIQIDTVGKYVNKVGDRVGQRWKRRLFNRQRVDPYDPKTTEQQNNRHKFGHATTAAAACILFNSGVSGFETLEDGEKKGRIAKAYSEMDGTENDVKKMPAWKQYPEEAIIFPMYRVYVYEDGIQIIPDEQSIEAGSEINVLVAWTNNETKAIETMNSPAEFPEVEESEWIDCDLSQAAIDSPVGVYIYSEAEQNPDEIFAIFECDRVEWG